MSDSKLYDAAANLRDVLLNDHSIEEGDTAWAQLGEVLDKDPHAPKPKPVPEPKPEPTPVVTATPVTVTPSPVTVVPDVRRDRS